MRLTGAGGICEGDRSVEWWTNQYRPATNTPPMRVAAIHQIGLTTDGTYRLNGVPVGPAKVGVSSPDPKPGSRALAGGDPRAKAGPPPLPPGAWFPLPAQYADPATSGVTVPSTGS